MSSYKMEQRRLNVGGRDFHFVSYDALPPNVRRGEPGEPAMWYLMGPGKRWPVMPQVVGQSEEEIDRGLMEWLKIQGIGRVRSGRA